MTGMSARAGLALRARRSAEAAHARHDEVHEDEIGRLRRHRRGQGVETGLGRVEPGDGVMAGGAQQTFQIGAKALGVVDDGTVAWTAVRRTACP